MEKRFLKSFVPAILAVMLVFALVMPQPAEAAYAVKQIWARTSATAGEALVTGDVVAIADADGYAYKADADTATRVPAVGIVGVAAASGAKVEIITLGIVSGWTSLAEGSPGYLSATAGAITQTAPKVAYSQQIGVAISTTDYLINPAAGPYALGTPAVICTSSHNYGGAAADWAMTAAEAACSFISVTNANGAVNAILPAAQPGKIWFISNGSGQVLTFKVTGGSGGTIANAKVALYAGSATDAFEIYEQP